MLGRITRPYIDVRGRVLFDVENTGRIDGGVYLGRIVESRLSRPVGFRLSDENSIPRERLIIDPEQSCGTNAVITDCLLTCKNGGCPKQKNNYGKTFMARPLFETKRMY
jgi:hypothetical protein